MTAAQQDREQAREPDVPAFGELDRGAQLLLGLSLLLVVLVLGAVPVL